MIFSWENVAIVLCHVSIWNAIQNWKCLTNCAVMSINKLRLMKFEPLDQIPDLIFSRFGSECSSPIVVSAVIDSPSFATNAKDGVPPVVAVLWFSEETMYAG